ncbi:efflux RND transporter periplasmic adaptor subunit [bacterium]|nr:efflux RND transporter periplasmic adaptor subunit [bacterium]
MRRAILSVLALAIFIAGCNKSSENQKNTGNKVIVGALRTRVVPARIGKIFRTVDYSGTIKGYREVPVAPGMSSWVTKILVKEGDKVRKGQLLARLSPEQLNQAEAQFRAAEENYNRMKNLLEKGSISQQQFDQIEAGYKAAKAMYELAIKNTELRAPFSGIVASINSEEGEFFNAMMPMAGAPAVLTVVDLRKVKVECEISERDIVEVKTGQDAFMEVDAFPDTTFWGKVESVEHLADPMSGTYKATVVFENGSGKLRSGMFATVHIITAEADSAIVIRQSAIVNDTLVFVSDGEKARARKVKLGIENDSLAQVIAGIKVGEPVIIEGTLGLFDGAPIIVKK